MSDVRTDFIFRYDVSLFAPAAYEIRNVIISCGSPEWLHTVSPARVKCLGCLGVNPDSVALLSGL